MGVALALALFGLVMVTRAALHSSVEAAAVGAGLVIIMGFILGKLTLRNLWTALKDSVVTTATVMLILIAAHMINPFLALSHIPQAVGEFLGSLDIPSVGILCLMLLCYLVLGCFLESGQYKTVESISFSAKNLDVPLVANKL